MEQIEKIMSIYYGHDRLPYKDYDRQVHYPIVGSDLFIGENNVSKIRFYVDRIGGSQFTWLAVVKLPDGSKAYRQLDAVSQDGYVDFDLASIYTSQVGAIFVSLQGYTSEDISITEDDDTYFVNGNPNILVTGVVKIMVNYAPQILSMGTDISYSQYQQIIALLSTKANLNQNVVFYDNIASIGSNEIAKENLKNNQLCFDNTTKWFYVYNSTSETFGPVVLKDTYGKKIVEIDTTNQKADLFGALPCLDYDMNVTLGTLIDKGYDKGLFTIKDSNGYARHIYSFGSGREDRTYIQRYSIETNAIQSYWNATTTARTKTLKQIFEDVTPTTTYNETTDHKVNSITSDNKDSTTQYPSNKGATDYVDTTAIASYTFDSTTYQIKFYNAKGTQIGATLDLPIESVVVSGSYDSVNKTIILTLANGNTITISVGDLVSGLVKTSDIVDNLTTNDGTKVLSAKQGKVLNDTKLNKLASSYHLCVYGHDSSGNETYVDYDSSVHANALALRDADGHVKTANPSGQWDSVNKGYGDSTYELVNNKTTSISSSSTDTQYPSAKCVYDKLEEIRAVAQAKTMTYATSVDLTDSDIADSIPSGLVHYFDSQGIDKVFASTSEFNTWKSGKTINQAFLTSTNFELSLDTELGATHYFVVLKGGNAMYVLDASTYDFLFKENDDLNLFEEYPDRWYFDGSLFSECRAPILTETTLVGAYIETSMSSLVTYMCTTALTSLEITNLTKATNDNNPTWQISFKTHASTTFEITLPVGVRWDNGTPTFYLDTEYTIIIKKSVVSGEYIAYLI